MSFDLQAYMAKCRWQVEYYVDLHLPPNDRLPGILPKSMRYSFFAGGKRFRPTLACAAADAVGGKPEAAIPFGAAIEMIHTYSLIHDDLPAMDDDALRRGKPTNHVKFGDAIAILAGDALLSDAFRILALSELREQYSADVILRCIYEIAHAAGTHGMVAGQALDVVSEGQTLELPTLEYLHTHKTGALIRASVLVGGISAGADQTQEHALIRYADRVGLAFQIADDILDVVGDTATLGKQVGSDAGLKKATYPAIMGLSEAKARLRDLVDEAVAYLEPFGERGQPLRELALFVGSRDN